MTRGCFINKNNNYHKKMNSHSHLKLDDKELLNLNTILHTIIINNISYYSTYKKFYRLEKDRYSVIDTI